MVKHKKQKGYVLAVVMLLSFLISVTLLSTFSIVYRYMRMSKDSLNDTAMELYVEDYGEQE